MTGKRKIKVAVTGSIGSGKSAFCKILKDGGLTVISADEIAKDLLASDGDIKQSIIKEFGSASYTGNTPDKKFLAEKVFSDPANVIKINSIVHPKVIEKVDILVSKILKSENIAVTEAALIYEADMENMFDYVVLVTAGKEKRLKRKSEISGMTAEQFMLRDENQIPDEEKKKRADFIFENNGTLGELKVKALLLINILKGLSATDA